jgi:hypothetical protein
MCLEELVATMLGTMNAEGFPKSVNGNTMIDNDYTGHFDRAHRNLIATNLDHEASRVCWLDPFTFARSFPDNTP